MLGFGPGSRRGYVPGGEDDALEGLGELAQLTVTNEADATYDVSPDAAFAKNFVNF